jgi:chromosomal replication initiation ATPase DnaA
MSARGEPGPDQLVLELPLRQALGAEDFLVSQSNAAAVALVDSWPSWPYPALLVVGPQGSGKSHLAHVWRLKSGAPRIAACSLAETAVSELERARALVVEDIDRGIGGERALFHILNLAREGGFSLLLTSRSSPGEFTIGLPDLRSRLRALPLAMLGAPDDGLLKAVLVKLFADRQLSVDPHVVSFIALHMGRSMEAANRVVAAADRLSLAMQRKVTRTIAAEALAAVAEESDGEP